MTLEPDLDRALSLMLAALDGKTRAVDSTLFDPSVPVIIQGITGRAGRTHAQLMQRYGTHVVGGVAASATASREPIGGIPVLLPAAKRSRRPRRARAC